MYGKIVTKASLQGFKPVKKYLNRHFLAPNYIFRSKIPKDNITYRALSPCEWQIEKNRVQSKRYMKYYAYFLIGFGLADFLVSLEFNPKQSYRLHTRYPIPIKIVDNVLQNIKAATNQFSVLSPKNYFQFVTFWEEFGILFSEKEAKRKQKDEKAIQLKQQIKQIDQKYKYEHK